MTRSVFVQTRSFDFALATRAIEANSPHTIVQDWQTFRAMLVKLQNSPRIAYDTETSGTKWFKDDRICGFAFTIAEAGRYLSWYVPIRHFTHEPQLNADEVIKAIKPILGDPRKEVICHNMPFDWHMSAQDGLIFGGALRDTMSEGHIFDENMPLALKVRADKVLNEPRAHTFEKILSAEIGRRAKDSKMKITAYKEAFGYSHIPISLCGIYACYDTEFTMRLADTYDANGTTTVFKETVELERELIPAVCRMEAMGMPLDVAYLRKVQERTDEAMWSLEPTIYEQTGCEFNISSDKELSGLLFSIGVPLTKTTASGAISVDGEALGHHVEDYPVIDLIIKYREASKLRSTYTESLLQQVDANDVLHGSFLAAGTNTGRFSSRNPNMQNMAGDSPRRAQEYSGKGLEEGGIDPFSIKRAFIPHLRDGKPQHRFYYDYSQVELRMLAHVTQDPTLLSVYLNDEDVHKRTQMEVFNNPAKEYRRLAKVINFGLVYGLSAAGFSRQTGVDLPTSEKFMAIFFERFPEIKPYSERLWAQTRADGCQFTNVFGRPRRLPDLNDPEGWIRGSAERKCIGSMVQGSAAHLTKRSIIRVDNWIRKEGIPAYLVSTIHDEIQLDMPPEYGREISIEVKKMMEDFPQIAPIIAKTDIESTATNWAEKKDYAL